MRYFFHTADGSRDRDELGQEFATLAEARLNAIRYAGECMSYDPSILAGHCDFRIEVTDERGRLLCTVIMLAVNAPASGEV